MTGRFAERTPDRSAWAVIALTLLALLLVAAVPLALLAAVVMMILGYVVGGLALFGGSILAAAIAVALAGVSGIGTREPVRARLPGRATRQPPGRRRRRASGQRLRQRRAAGPQPVHRSSLT